MSGNDRGQAFTLEGIIGTLIVLVAVIFALQAVDVAPFADDARDEATDSLRVQVDDMLAAAADRGALRHALTCVDGRGDVDRNVANPDQPVTDLGVLLNQTLSQSGNQFIVAVEYREDGGGGSTFERERLYPAGEGSPPDAAVSVTRQVVIHESDPIYRTEGFDCVPDPGGQTVGNTSNLYVGTHPDVSDADPVHNVVRIRVIAW